MIDEQSLEKYRNMKGPFGEQVRNSIDWKEGCFLQCDKRCAFLNIENLCDLHIVAGEHMLCDTCRDYPRHKEEFEGVREGSLSLSCVEAAKIVLGCKEPVQFIVFEDEEEDEEFEDFDYLLYTKLMDARERIIGILQNRNLDIMVRMKVVISLAKQMQDAYDNDEVFKMDEIIEMYGNMDYLFELQKQMDKPKDIDNSHCSNMRKLFRVFTKLEVLKEDWPEYVKKAEHTLFGEGQFNYETKRQRFHKSVGMKSASYDTWSCWIEQLMVYFVFTYFCGAVYDGNILGKIQMATVSILLIQELSMAKWMEQNEEFGFGEFVDIAHRVSREIEHSDLNLIRMEKICEKTPVCQPEQLQQLLVVL